MRVLFVSATVNTTFPVERMLRALGVEFNRALMTGAGLATPSGVISWTDTSTMRGYLRQHRAVLVYDSADSLSVGDRASHRTWAWLGFNAPEDPPIAYFKVNLHSGLAGSNLPMDFPLVRPNTSDLDNTAVRLQFNTANANYELHGGLHVRLVREGAEVYVPAASTRVAGGALYAYRLDPTKHAALGANGEVVAVPVSEDLAFPSEATLAYRYRKHHILPMLETRGGYFWLLYGLKLLGVRPERVLSGFLLMDDALTVNNFAGRSGQPTRAQFARIGYETYRYLAEEFYPRTGCAMVCGLFTGGRYGRQSEPLTATIQTHWQLVVEGKYRSSPTTVADLEPDAHARIVQWHNLLVAHHSRGLPCTIHDHTIRHRQNRVWSSFVRHADGGFRYAAPNDVPKGAGVALVRREQFLGSLPPGAVEREVGGEVYYELGCPTTGSGTTISDLSMRSVHGARVAWESAVAEMRVLGFPDAHGGEQYRLVISPNYLTGGPAVWRVLREIGYELVRTHLGVRNDTPSEGEFDVNPTMPVFEGLHTVGSEYWDCGSTTGGTFGLYHTQPYNAVSMNGLDLSNDIVGVWGTDRVVAARCAYRRYIGMASERWLRSFSVLDVLPTMHPPAMLSWSDPVDPLRPIEFGDPEVRINFLLELAWNLERVVQVLEGYIRFGTVRDYVKAREGVFGG